MSRIRLNMALYCTAVLAFLALRVLVPAGYMPAAAGSGLLFELCPEGLPPAFISAISGSGHHHHHAADDSAQPGSTSDNCPVGHMLSSSVAFDDAHALQWLPAPVSCARISAQSSRCANRAHYLSRGPPA